MKVTEKASAQLKKLMKESELPVSAVRLTATKGCCGPAIQVSLAEKANYCDFCINIGDVDFFIEPEANELILRATIDYRDEQFTFEGLKKSGSCC